MYSPQDFEFKQESPPRNQLAIMGP